MTTASSRREPVRITELVISHLPRTLRVGLMLAAMGGVASLIGCSDTPASPDTSGGSDCCDPPLSLIVSDPVAGASLAPAGVTTFVLTSSANEVVYVSLPPGTAPGGTRAILRRVGDIATVTTPLREGGFDPVPVAAQPGDSIEARIVDAAGHTTQVLRLSVAANRPPIIVRTYPRRKKTDVPLNTAIVIVFSEPVASSTLTGASIRLLRGTTTVAGNASLLPGSTTGVRFTPSSPLVANTEYTLVVTQAVRDLSGDSLAQRESATFTTGTDVLGAVTSVAIAQDSLVVPVGAQFQFVATAYDALGHEVPGRPVLWSSQNPSIASVSTTGLVTALTEGVATINAQVDGVIGSQRISVSAAALPVGFVRLFPDSSGELVGQTLNVSAQLSDIHGAYIYDPRPMRWQSLDPSLASVVEFASSRGTSVTGVAPGLARIVGTADGVSDTALVSIHDVAQLLVSPSSLSLVLQERGSATSSALGDDGVTYPVVWSEVTWASSDPSVASVSSIGEISGLKSGSATITATWHAHTATADVTVVSLSFTSVTSGDHHMCGVTVSSDAYCWGFNLVGEIGNGIGATRQFDFPALVKGAYTFGAISVGKSYTCGLTTAGVAYCWGKNDAGQLGDGTNTDHATPVPVSGGNTFVSIGTGSGHACGVTASGDAYCWGGDGTTAYGNAPVVVSAGLNFVSLTAGADHTCALTTSGAAYCWGGNSTGQLGDGTATARSTPVPVVGGITFASISAGSGQTCAVTPSGNGYCWGANGSGQLGDGTTVNRLSPVPVSGSLTFASMSAGPSHTCALSTSGSAYCWGYDYAGQLGTGSAQAPWIDSLPRAVIGGYTFTQLSAGGELGNASARICAVTALGVAYCWLPSPLKVLGQP